jgi:hypothetical protein
MKLTASYQFDATAGRDARNQVWDVRPGQTKAVLLVRPDGSGTLTVAGLAPQDPQAEGDSLGDPLNVTLSSTCG